VSGKKVLEEHSVFSNCHIIGVDTVGLVFLVSAYNKLPAGRVCNAACLQVCRPTAGYSSCNSSTRMRGKTAGQGCIARVHAMVQYAKSIVKLDNNAVF
jgi:hypothetical protein